MPSVPADPQLYARIKRKLYARVPVHSAYRSGLLVQAYKRAGGTYVRVPGKGKKKKEEQGGLARWFREKWATQSGNRTYKSKSDIFRPTKRVTRRTPVTLSELTPEEIRRARREKYRRGRVRKFRKR